MTEIQHPTTTQSTMQSVYIECDTCGHCVDMNSPKAGQPENLTKAQHTAADTVSKWLTEAKEAKLTMFMQ